MPIGAVNNGGAPIIRGHLYGLKSVNGSYTNGCVTWTMANREGVYGSGRGAYGDFLIDAAGSSGTYNRTDGKILPAHVNMWWVIKY